MVRPKRKHQVPFWTRRNVRIVTGITVIFVALAVPAIGAMASGVTP